MNISGYFSLFSLKCQMCRPKQIFFAISIVNSIFLNFERKFLK